LYINCSNASVKSARGRNPTVMEGAVSLKTSPYSLAPSFTFGFPPFSTLYWRITMGVIQSGTRLLIKNKIINYQLCLGG